MESARRGGAHLDMCRMAPSPSTSVSPLPEGVRKPTTGQDWCEPGSLPGELPEVPALDSALLPKALRPWITDIADRIQCPLDYPAAGVMVALAGVVGRQIAIRPQLHDDWTVIPNLWGAIIGRPGLLKTPALAEVLRPIRHLEAQARECYDRQMLEHDASRLVQRQAAKQAEREVATALKQGNRKKATDVALAAQQGESEPPARRRYLTQDSTVEKLGELLAANPRGILVFRDELTGWLRSMDREGHEGARSFYLEAWNGTGSYTYDRIGRGTIDIEAACVSILGSIQPGPLRAYISDALRGGASDDGLLQRFQVVVWPDPPTGWKEVDRWPNTEARQDALEVFRRLDCIDPASLRADTSDALPYCRFCQAGLEAWREFRARLEARLRSGVEAPAFEAALAKQRSLVPSLALLIHLADNPEGGPVTEQATLQAIAWAEYLEDHARRLYAPALDRAGHAARALGEKIRSGELGTEFKARDVYRRGWSGLDRESCDLALDLLESVGWLCSAEVPTDGRPYTEWRVNPRIYQ